MSNSIYKDEIKFIAIKFELTCVQVILLQYIYDIYMKNILIGYNDFLIHMIGFNTIDAIDCFSDLSIKLDFKRDGKTLFYATSFLGLIGIYSAFMPNNFSIAINSRSSTQGFHYHNYNPNLSENNLYDYVKSFLKNDIYMNEYGLCGNPISTQALRYILENKQINTTNAFDENINILMFAHLNQFNMVAKIKNTNLYKIRQKDIDGHSVGYSENIYLENIDRNNLNLKSEENKLILENNNFESYDDMYTKLNININEYSSITEME